MLVTPCGTVKIPSEIRRPSQEVKLSSENWVITIDESGDLIVSSIENTAPVEINEWVRLF